MNMKRLSNWLLAPADVLRLASRYRELLLALTWRQITQAHAGQALGFVWAVIHPLAQAGIYVAVFSIVFRLKFDAGAESGPPYTLYLLAGMLPWLTCANVIMRSTVEITSQANLVKQIVFPTELLPMRLVLAAAVVLALHLLTILLYLLVVGDAGPMLLWVPVLFVAQIAALLGLAFLISSISVFVLDLKEVLQLLVTIGPFLAPVVYQLDMLPTPMRVVVEANPFTHMVLCYHDVFYYQSLQHPLSWAVWLFTCAILLAVGYRGFGGLKPLFGSAL